MLSPGHEGTCAELLLTNTPQIGRCTHHILASGNSRNPVLPGVVGLDIHVAVDWLMSLRPHHVWLLARRPGEQTSVLEEAHVYFHPKRFVLSFTLAELLQQHILELSFPGAPGHAKNGNWKPKATDSRTACTDALLIMRLEASIVAPR